ncbi:hypothetical protein ACOMHN_053531 [Nucella lapillus]
MPAWKGPEKASAEPHLASSQPATTTTTTTSKTHPHPHPQEIQAAKMKPKPSAAPVSKEPHITTTHPSSVRRHLDDQTVTVSASRQKRSMSRCGVTSAKESSTTGRGQKPAEKSHHALRQVDRVVDRDETSKSETATTSGPGSSAVTHTQQQAQSSRGSQSSQHSSSARPSKDTASKRTDGAVGNFGRIPIRTSAHRDDLLPRSPLQSLNTWSEVDPRPSHRSYQAAAQQRASYRVFHKGPYHGSPQQRRALQKGPSEGSSLHRDKRIIEKGPCQGSSLHGDKRAVQKGPSEGSSLHGDKRISVEKGPCQVSSQHTDGSAAQKELCPRLLVHTHTKVPQKGPCQGSVLDMRDNKAAERGPSQGSPPYTDNSFAQRGARQGSPLYTDNRVAQKGPIQGSPRYTDSKIAQMGPIQGYPRYTDNRVAQKGPIQGSPRYTDSRISQNGPIQGSPRYTDNRVAQKGPIQGSPHYTDNRISQNGPIQGSPRYTDSRIAQKGPIQGSPHYTDNRVAQKGPIQGSPRYTDSRIAQKGPIQGSPLYTDTRISQNGPSQGSPRYTDSRISQKGPIQGSPRYTDSRISQKEPIQGSPHYTDNRVAQKGPIQGSPHYTDNRVSQKGPIQGSPRYTDSRISQNGPIQGSPRYTDNRVAQKGPIQGSPHYTDNRISQNGPIQGSPRYTDSRIAQKGPIQGSPHYTDNRVAQKGPIQGSPRYTDNRVAQKGPIQGSPLCENERAAQKGPCQESLLLLDSAAQKGPGQGLLTDIDDRVDQKGPSQGSVLDRGNKDGQHMGPYQGVLLDRDNECSQKGPCQGSSLHANNQDGPGQGPLHFADSAQKGPREGSLQGRENRDAQEGRCQGLAPPKPVQNGICRGAPFRACPKPTLQGPAQGLLPHAESRTAEQGPCQGSSQQNSDITPSQKGSHHREPSLYTDHRAAQESPGEGLPHYSPHSRPAAVQGPPQEPPDARALQRGPFQRSSLHMNDRPAQKGPCEESSHEGTGADPPDSCQGPSLHADCRPAQQGPCQGILLDTDSRAGQQGPRQGILLDTDSRTGQPCPGSSQRSVAAPNQKGPNPGLQDNRPPQPGAGQRYVSPESPPSQTSGCTPESGPPPRLSAHPHHRPPNPACYRPPFLPFGRMPFSSAGPRWGFRTCVGMSGSVVDPRPALPERGSNPMGPRHGPPPPPPPPPLSDSGGAPMGCGRHPHQAQDTAVLQAGPPPKVAPPDCGGAAAPAISCADSSNPAAPRVSTSGSMFRPLLQPKNKGLQACPNPRLSLPQSGPRMSQPDPGNLLSMRTSEGGPCPRPFAPPEVSGNMQPQSLKMSEGGPCPRPFVPSEMSTSQTGTNCMPPYQAVDGAVCVRSNPRPSRPPVSHNRPVPQPYPRLPVPPHGKHVQPVSPMFRPLQLPHASMPLWELVRRPPPFLLNRPRGAGPLGPVFRPPARLHGRLPLPYPPTRPLLPPPHPHPRLPLPPPGNRPPISATVTRPQGEGPDPRFLLKPLACKWTVPTSERAAESCPKFPGADGGSFPSNPFMGLSIKGNWCTVPKELGHGDKDERTYIQLEPSLKMMFSFDVDNPVKWTISPDRRASHSFDGSCISDSLSTKTDTTDSSSRDTPMSWDVSSQLKRKLLSGSCPSMCFCHKFNTPFFPRDEQESNVISDSASSKDGLWDAQSVENQDIAGSGGGQGARPVRTLAGCEGLADTGFQCHCPACSPGDHIRRVGWKRHREGSPALSDLDLDWEERLWRTAAKRLRLNGEEVQVQTESQTAEATAAADDTPSWTRSSPADLYFTRSTEQGAMKATQRMKDLEDTFEEELVKRAEKARSSSSSSSSSSSTSQPVASETAPPPSSHPPPTHAHHHHQHHRHHCHHHRRHRRRCHSSCSSSSSSSDSEPEEGGVCNSWMDEMDQKRKHPFALHSELWYNDSGQMNNGLLCRCSPKARKTGIRHNVYPGEEVVDPCDPASNNVKRLYHYRITMSPSTNFLTNSPTVIRFDNHEFIFEGFSLLTHEKLDNVPVCKVIRFHIEYTIHFIEEQVPENFTIRSLDLVTQFLFKEVLELVDLDWVGPKDGCQLFHIMPRFARLLPENGKEILSMNEVLKFLLRSSRPLVNESDLPVIQNLDQDEWQSWVEKVCGMIVTCPGRKPGAIRVDQLDRTQLLEGQNKAPPILVHFGIRPAHLSYAGDPSYQKAWKHYIKFKHLLNSKPKVSREDKLRLRLKEAQLQEIQRKSSMKREVTVELSSKGFLRTGLHADICQHALLLPVLVSHLRFHSCLATLEQHLQYSFQDRSLLQLALTHTSFRCNYGTNPAHARNSLTNCGLRQVEYGDRRIYYQNTRKRGINILVDIMSRMGRKEETPSDIPHNERLEFLGDAVIEFLSSVHLFFMFPWLEEGGLSTYRTAIVQNQHLAILAENLRLQDFMLFVHGPDLCHESDLRHAMANCFEALMDRPWPTALRP